jgi:hypothetical protein
MYKKIPSTFVLVIFFPLTVNANTELNLICKGTTFGEKVATSNDEFSLSVNTKSGALYGMPAYKVPGCMSFGGDEPPRKIELTELEAKLSCSNKEASTTMRLNRKTLQLNFIHFWNGAEVFGSYRCEKVKGSGF